MFEDGGEAEPASVGVVRIIIQLSSALIAAVMLLGIAGYLK
jgi:hypothetical protein